MNGVAGLGLSYNLMTQYTSFVAVEERVVTKDGKPQRVEVPVEMPEGVSYEGVFGEDRDKLAYAPNAGLTMYAQLGKATNGARVSGGSGAGIGAGTGGGIGGGTFMNLSPPPPAVAMPSVVTNGERRSPVPDAKPSGDRSVLESKLSPALMDAFDCWQEAKSNCKLVKNGKVDVELFLSDSSTVVLDQLKALGFVASQTRPREKIVVGLLPMNKITEVAKMKSVRFVTPLGVK